MPINRHLQRSIMFDKSHAIESIGDYAFATNNISRGLENIIMRDNAPTIGKGTFDYVFSRLVIPENAVGYNESPWTQMAIYSQERIYGKCGSNLTWELSENGILKIEGSGNMYNFYTSGPDAGGGYQGYLRPWGITQYQINEIIVDAKEATIGDKAFSGYRNLTNITISEGITSIGGSAFFDCSSIETINLPTSLLSIGGSAFLNCSKLKNICIPANVTEIGPSAFQGCSSLKNITIPEGMEQLSFPAIFKDCSNLSSVSIPKSVTFIWNDVFDNCSNLTIYGEENSYAHTYALEHDIPFKSLIPSENPDSPDNPDSLDKSSIIKAEVTLSKTSYTYDGSAKTPAVTMKLNGKTLILNTDYAVSYSNNTNVGTATVTVTGIGSYTGIVTKNFTIILNGGDSELDTSKINITKATITLSQSSYTYDGWQKKPSVTVKLNGKTLEADTDYMVIYSDNINIGTAKVVIIGKGDYTGNKTVNFTIAKTAEEEDSSITCKKTVYKVSYGAKPFKINAAYKRKLSFTSSVPKIAAVDKNTGTA